MGSNHNGNGRGLSSSLLFVLCSLLSNLTPSSGCMKTSSGGGGGAVTPTTTAIPAECPQRDCTPALYTDVSFMSSSGAFGMVNPVANCARCATGQANYYPDSANAVPNAVNMAAIGIMGGATCQNYCACQSDGTCWQPINTLTSSVVLYPFCDNGTPSVYLVVMAQGPTDGIRSTAGQIILASQQQDPVTFRNLPVNNGPYPKVTAVSCNGCNFARSCNGGPSP